MSYLLSFWLTLLFICGQGAHIPQLLVAAVGLGAIFAGLGGMIAPMVNPALRLAAPVALSLGLLTLGAVGIAMRVSPWMPFLLISGAVWYVGIVIAEVLWSPRNRGTMAPADS